MSWTGHPQSLDTPELGVQSRWALGAHEFRGCMEDSSEIAKVGVVETEEGVVE